MIWKVLVIVFGWLLCGVWGLRMGEKPDDTVYDSMDGLIFYIFGPIALILMWCIVWPARLLKFGEGVIEAWRKSK